MARQIIGATSRQSSTVAPTAGTQAARGGKVLTTSRSARYLQAMQRLDTQGLLSPADLDGIIDAIRRDFDDKWAATPLGLVAKCYLGHPFEVHILSFDDRIIEHYRLGEKLPGALQRAREVAKDELYGHIEVYSSRLVCVRSDGSTVALEG